MLGISYAQIESNSVGYKTDYEMHSLDFEEFLWVCGHDASTIESVLSHIQNVRPFSATEMQVFSKAFQDYCILGGMPAVVKRFVESKTFESSLAIQRQLILDYEEDFFLRTHADLIPVEVKSNTGRSKSLRTLIESQAYPDINWGIKLHAGNIGNENSIFSLPYFCTFLLRRFLASLN